jgi:iron complex outermembrane recepter protein
MEEVLHRWCCIKVAKFVLATLLVCMELAEADAQLRTHTINVPSLKAVDAFNRLAEQTGTEFLFPYDIAETRTTHAVVGTYTVMEALKLMLQNTGLSRGLSEKGAIRIFLSDGSSNNQEGTKTVKAKKNILSSVIAFIVGAGGVQYSIAQETEKNGIVMEEVVVTSTGYRKSLEKAMDLKRNNAAFVDVIVATDIAAFPDQNLAEALQRIPGVAIERSVGQGKKVSIRSLGSAFTHSTINGLNAASSSGGRELQFDIFSSDLIQNVSVSKSPMAQDEEGGVAGVVAIQTARPFDYDGFKMVLSGEGAYNSVSGEKDPRLAFLVSNSFADETIGVLFGLTGEDRTHRSNSVEMANNRTDALPGLELEPGTIFMQNGRTIAKMNRSEKRGGLLALQYRPTENLLLGSDIMAGTSQDYKEEYRQESNYKDSVTVTDYTVDENNVLVAATMDNGKNDLKSKTAEKDNDFWQVGFNADWQVDDWNIKGLIALAQTDEVEPISSYEWRNRSEIGFVLNDEYADRIYENDMSQYYARKHYYEERTKEDKKSTVKMDVERMLDISWVDTVQFGLSYSGKSTSRDKFKGNVDYEGNGRFASDDGAVPIGDVIPGGGFEIDGAEFSSVLMAVPFDVADALYGDLPFTTAEDIGNYFKIEEDVLAAYVQGNMEFDIGRYPTKLNTGLRYVDTEQSSGGYYKSQAEPDPRKHSIERSYDNWLPSLNMKVELSDELFLRFSTARVMTRPALDQLTGKFDIKEDKLEISAGNPYLDPLEADQYDVSLEYYFKPESLVALGYFYKDLKTYLTDSGSEHIMYEGQEYLIKRKINAEGATLQGGEFIYQQPFTFLSAPFDGFGFNFNYTYLESTAGTSIGDTGRSAPLKNLSRNAFNSILYYEKHGFDIRFAYNYKSKSVNGVSGGYVRYNDSFGQLDMSAGYQINDNIKVTLKGINVTDETNVSFSEIGSRNYPYVLGQQGRRVSLGVRFTL